MNETEIEPVFRLAKMEQFDQIYSLAKKNSTLLGPVMPMEIRQAIITAQCLVCCDNEKDIVVGFTLFTLLKTQPYMMTVNIICVSERYRHRHIAREMLSYMMNTYRRDIKTTCLKGTDSELFWQKVATKVQEEPGKKRPICRYKIRCNKRKRLF